MSVDVELVADQMWAAAQQGDYRPAPLVGSLSYEQGLDVQLALLDRKIAEGARLGGWKVGLTSPRARKGIGVDERPFGHILAERILPSGSSVEAAVLTQGGVEPEMMFTFGEAVEGSNPSEDELRGAVSRVSAGFELNEFRAGSGPFDFPMMVADGMAQWGVVEGSGITDIGDLNEVEVLMASNGEQRAHHISKDVLDDHWASLNRLVAVLARHGRRIEAGHRVITGAFCRMEAQAGDLWTADYGGIGSVEVRLA